MELQNVYVKIMNSLPQTAVQDVTKDARKMKDVLFKMRLNIVFASSVENHQIVMMTLVMLFTVIHLFLNVL
jgi:protein gp37